MFRISKTVERDSSDSQQQHNAWKVKRLMAAKNDAVAARSEDGLVILKVLTHI